MQAKNVYLSVATAIHDLDNTNRRWTWNYTSGQSLPSLQTLLNDAQTLLVSLEPRASATTNVWELSSGVKQSIPSGYRSILDITRNMGDDGNTPGRAISRVSSRQDMDALFQATFYDELACTSTYVDHYFYDPMQDGEEIFWVYPCPADNVYVEGILSKEPVAVSAETDELDILDRYKNALVHIILYFIYRTEGDDRNIALANHYVSMLAQELSMKVNVEKLYIPQPGG